MVEFEETILITGGTSGLGYHTARHLGRAVPKAKVVIAARSDKDEVAAALNRELNVFHKRSDIHTRQVEFMPIDLSSLANVQAFVTTFHERGFPAISILCLNAGVQYHGDKQLRYTKEGVEATFGTNHVGHCLLFFLLLSRLKPDARIAIVASGTHDPAQKTMAPDAEYVSAKQLAYPTDGKGYGAMKGVQRYASSKLANVMWMHVLERHLKEKRMKDGSCRWSVCAFDPGLMPGTSLGRNAPKLFVFIMVHILSHMIWLLRLLSRSQNIHTPYESGANLANRALHLNVSSSGEYVEGEKVISSSLDSHNVEKQDDLWRWTTEFIGKDGVEKQAFRNLNFV